MNGSRTLSPVRCGHRPRPERRSDEATKRRTGRGIAASLAALVMAGCSWHSGAGPLRSRSLGRDPVVLSMNLPLAVYGRVPSGETSFMLSDVPVADLLAGKVRDGQILHVELLWIPKAGATPMDASATNVSIRHVIVSGGEVGVYGGAGFALPSGAPGDEQLTLTMEDATMRLLFATAGFEDLLSPARIRGTFTARQDALTARKLRIATSQLVTNAMGRSELVALPPRSFVSLGGPARGYDAAMPVTLTRR